MPTDPMDHAERVAFAHWEFLEDRLGGRLWARLGEVRDAR